MPETQSPSPAIKTTLLPSADEQDQAVVSPFSGFASSVQTALTSGGSGSGMFVTFFGPGLRDVLGAGLSRYGSLLLEPVCHALDADAIPSPSDHLLCGRKERTCIGGINMNETPLGLESQLVSVCEWRQIGSPNHTGSTFGGTDKFNIYPEAIRSYQEEEEEEDLSFPDREDSRTSSLQEQQTSAAKKSCSSASLVQDHRRTCSCCNDDGRHSVARRELNRFDFYPDDVAHPRQRSPGNPIRSNSPRLYGTNCHNCFGFANRQPDSPHQCYYRPHMSNCAGFAHYATPRHNPLARSCPSFFSPFNAQDSETTFVPICVLPFQQQPAHVNNSVENSIPKNCACPECTYFATSVLRQPGKSSPQAASSCPHGCHFVPSEPWLHHPEGCDLVKPFEAEEHILSSLRPMSRQEGGKLLWLSEEEAEIIRLIRLSSSKVPTASSLAGSQESSVIATTSSLAEHPTRDIEFDNGKVISHLSSGFSSCSTEDLEPNDSKNGVHDLMDTDIKSTRSVEDPLCMSIDDRKKSSNLKKNEEKGWKMQRGEATAVIQQFWRRYMEKKEKDLEEKQKIEALKFLSGLQHCQENFMHSAITEMNHGRLVNWYNSLQRAAIVIQQAWHAASKMKKEKTFSSYNLPKNMKDYYNVILWRHIHNKIEPPKYERFVKLVQRIQAATEGNRIRHRLKSRRLQIIIKEIKEIKLILQDLSGESKSESMSNLLSQLTMQLQQKFLQLHTALSGSQDAVRALLRRTPTTPLVIGASDSLQCEISTTDPSVDTSERSIQPPIRLKDMIGDSKDETSTVTYPPPVADKAPIRMCFRQTITSQIAILEKGKKPVKDVPGVVYAADKQCRSSKAMEMNPTSMVGSATIFLRDEALRGNKAQNREKYEDYQQLSSFISLKNEQAKDKPSRNISSVVSDTDVEDRMEQMPSTRHPFLKRKSIAMAPQKLDWSKVKPMVSSRLEPKLKTQGHEEKVRSISSLKRNLNYSQVKSRLFNYKTSTSTDFDDVDTEKKCGETEMTKRNQNLSRKVKTSKSETRVSELEEQVDLGPKIVIKSEKGTEVQSSGKIQRSRQPSHRYVRDKMECTAEKPSMGQFPTHRTVLETKNGYLTHLLSTEPKEREGNSNIERQQSLNRNHFGTNTASESSSQFTNGTEEANTYSLHQQTRRAERSPLEEGLLFSKELGKMYKEFVSRKCGKIVTLGKLFGSQEDSIIPRLHPLSPIFKAGSHDVIKRLK